MKPVINDTEFGSITIDGKEFLHDVVIRLNGRIEKRKKKLSKIEYGTSHIISLEEAKYIFEEGARQLIIGTGQTGYVELSSKAEKFFRDKNCKIQLLSTPKAVLVWNDVSGATIGLFHVTC